MAERKTKAQLERDRYNAQVLYTRERLTQKEIAEKTGVSEKTIGKWVVDGGWDKLQKNFLLTREEQMGMMLDELNEINAYIKSLPAGFRFADAKLGDVRRKLVKDIKELETKAALPEIIAALKILLDFIRKVNLQDAQLLSKYCDALIKSLLR
ncbi:helix-turn-helix domain-containing protein [Mucilaginibacter sp. L3T2-6]|uniref:helix-turn-helix domain-containing protein n=1 Tax=Mucilaginibacter sp. L3T2-6 TaxID=3062491 RepID=UPI0026771E58|nr:helix-turn-helix domain-containing protein [Mucilaginibacter sp. L3T2-6]MDO3641968.1 hypothetical protein [Mucilaginibacter sp. L3T2-6]MDV6214354.1 hypothetical protein [Mucilaginibacter sp. L3T2-6]